MPTRKSSAVWEGGLKGGKGNYRLGSTGASANYNFGSRFEEGVGSNPEELLAAAEAACYSMALSGSLESMSSKDQNASLGGIFINYPVQGLSCDEA